MSAADMFLYSVPLDYLIEELLLLLLFVSRNDFLVFWWWTSIWAFSSRNVGSGNNRVFQSFVFSFGFGSMKRKFLGEQNIFAFARFVSLSLAAWLCSTLAISNIL